MYNNKVVITGLGCINCAGNDVEEFWTAVQQGKSGLISNHPGEINDSNLMKTGGFVPNVICDKFGERTTQLAYIAANQAMEDADLINNRDICIGVSFGTSIGGYEAIEGYLKNSNYSKIALKPGYTANFLAERYNLTGPVITNSAACAASSNSFGSAIQAIRAGMCDCMLVGGADPVSYMSQSGFVALKAMTKEFCRPFNIKDNPGIQIGEGAAFVVLESLSSAKNRGATIFAEVSGYGCCNEAYHETAPDPSADGAVYSIQRAMEMANITSEDIDYINMHGTGTRLNDAMEITAVHRLFSTNKKVKISSIKGAVGHMLGCAGATEAVITIMSIIKQELPKNVLLKEPMNDEIPLVVDEHEKHDIIYAMSNSFAFGGNASCVIFGKYKNV